jgi:hypothetical protein
MRSCLAQCVPKEIKADTIIKSRRPPLYGPYCVPSSGDVYEWGKVGNWEAVAWSNIDNILYELFRLETKQQYAAKLAIFLRCTVLMYIVNMRALYK